MAHVVGETVDNDMHDLVGEGREPGAVFLEHQRLRRPGEGLPRLDQDEGVHPAGHLVELHLEDPKLVVEQEHVEDLAGAAGRAVAQRMSVQHVAPHQPGQGRAEVVSLVVGQAHGAEDGDRRAGPPRLRQGERCGPSQEVHGRRFGDLLRFIRPGAQQPTDRFQHLAPVGVDRLAPQGPEQVVGRRRPDQGQDGVQRVVEVVQILFQQRPALDQEARDRLQGGLAGSGVQPEIQQRPRLGPPP